MEYRDLYPSSENCFSCTLQDSFFRHLPRSFFCNLPRSFFCKVHKNVII